jgi:hypothetical protein
MKMKEKYVFVLSGLLFISFVCIGCTTISGNVESALSFPTPIPIDDLIVGSFTYNINDSYVVLPDGLLAPAFTINEKNYPELYDVVVNEGMVGAMDKPVASIKLKNELIIASYDALYSWAIMRAAENAGITNIIAIKSFLATTTKNTFVASISRQDVTITVYGVR